MRSVLSTSTLAVLLCFSASAEDISKYRDQAARLIGASLEDNSGMKRLEFLCDRIGNRLSGSAALERAIAWSAEEMKRAGLENVKTQPVKVNKWVRGAESLVQLQPVERPLAMLGLGNSMGTPPAGLTADLVVVSTFDELAALGRSKIAGKIVLFNAPFTGYGQTVRYRAEGPSRAGALGAVAVLVRSITPVSLSTPHTGALTYSEDAPKIPAAAVSIEVAESLARLYRSGATPRVRLKMEAHFEEPVMSANVMGEIRGREKPDEVVVLGGHIDSWDVGQGAQDDGSGIMAALQAVAVIRKLGLQPRRTIRVVFWVNEENGGAGGAEYRRALGDKLATHVAAIEMDGGAEKPSGFGFGTGRPRRERGAGAPTRPEPPPTTPAAFQRVAEIGMLLDGIEADRITPGGGGADIAPLIEEGVPGFGLSTSGEVDGAGRGHYFDWHHTEADTFDKVNAHDFNKCVAALAVMSFVLADMPERLSDLK